MKTLFSPSWESASRASALTRQKMFVLFADSDSDAAKTLVYENPTYDIPSALTRNFVCVEVKPGSDIGETLLQTSAFESPLFGVAEGLSLVDAFEEGSEEDFETFLRNHVAELPQKNQHASPSRPRRLSRKEEELALLRAQIEADKRERQAQRRFSAEIRAPREEHEKKQEKSISASQCKLSIRLLDGETCQGTFESTQTLRDVKRWIEKEKGLVLTPEVDDALPSFAQTTGSLLNHYAFCYLGVPRVTFSVGQELTQLGDLGLCPRSALILKPVHGAQEKKASPGLWSSVAGKFGFLTKALYTFFDYGLEDAERDFSDEPVEAAQPLFVVPEKKEEEEEAEEQKETSVPSSNSAGMSPVSGRGNQSHIMHDSQASEKR